MASGLAVGQWSTMDTSNSMTRSICYRAHRGHIMIYINLVWKCLPVVAEG